MEKTIYIVSGYTESGDTMEPLAFALRPTKHDLSKIAHEFDGCDDKDGPGYDGSYTHITVTKTTLDL